MAYVLIIDHCAKHVWSVAFSTDTCRPRNLTVPKSFTEGT